MAETEPLTASWPWPGTSTNDGAVGVCVGFDSHPHHASGNHPHPFTANFFSSRKKLTSGIRHATKLKKSEMIIGTFPDSMKQKANTNGTRTSLR